MDFKSQAVRMREANLNKVIEKRSFLIWYFNYTYFMIILDRLYNK